MSTPNLPNRRSIRLKNYDYSAAGLYFITLCTINREHIFGQIINGEMHYNAFGTIATEEWAKTPEIRKIFPLANLSSCPTIFTPYSASIIKKNSQRKRAYRKISIAIANHRRNNKRL